MALSPGTESTSTEALLLSANLGFDAIFSNKLGDARAAFTSGPADSPFHLLGLGVCAFLEAALGMEAGLMAEAGKLLAQAEAGAKAASAKAAKEKKAKAGKGQPGDGGGRFVAGVEYEILAADAVVLLGLTHALSESYMGYLQCMYSLNAAHSKFTKLYKSVFPTGLDAYHTPVPSRSPSSLSLSAASISTASASASPSESGASTPSSAAPSVSTPAPSTLAPPKTSSLFGRWGASVTSLASSTSANKAELEEQQRIEKYERERPPNGPVEEMVVAGTAFGFGLFNLVFSLLPKRIQSVVGLLGFKHDRPLALRALAVSAGVSTLDGNATVTFTGGGKDVHGVFAGLVLMTFHGVVLLMSGWQADEANTLRTYKAIVDKIEGRYPDGALWILNRAKILRMSNDAPGAIAVLEAGLAPSPTSSPSQRFQQADTLLVFELAWTLLAQRRHKDAADAFLRLTELNSWSHATYVFIAAGCYVSLARAATAAAVAGSTDKEEEEESKTGTALAKEHFDTAQMLLLRVQGLLDGTYTPPEGSAAAKAGGRARKVGGKDLPTEVLIRKKLEFYKEKQKRRGGDLAQYVEAVGVSGADELAIFWNTHQRISDAVAEAHIAELASLSPPVVLAGAESPYLGGGVGSNPASPQVNATSLSTLDTPDELALRCLLLGILHRTLKHHTASRVLLEVARTTPVGTKAGGGSNDKTASTWISGVAAFELAVLDLREGQAAAEAEAEANTPGSTNSAAVWTPWLAAADGHLDAAQAYAGKGEIDLSSRLDSRVALLRDEIGRKRAVLV